MDVLEKLQHRLLKRIQRENCATLSSRRIYILPTREGVIYALMVLVMLAAAINFNNSLVFFFTFLLAGVGLISMHMTQQNLIGLQFSIAHVKPVFCFQNLYLPLIISQSGGHSLLGDKNNFSIDIQFAEDQADEISHSDVYNHDKTQLQLSTPTTQRGHLTLAPITVSTRYPLGLFRAWANIGLNNDAVIYPHPSPKTSHVPLSGSDSEGQGTKGRGFDDFSGFKSYQPGESLKHIHWKAYAREQGLLCKTFTGSNNREYWIDWHDFPGDIEKRLSKMCGLILDAETRGDRYGLILPGTTINISQGFSHQHQCLKALALY